MRCETKNTCNKSDKSHCKQTVLVQLIFENVVICFWTQSICKTLFCIIGKNKVDRYVDSTTLLKYAKSHTKQWRQAIFQQNEVASFLGHHVDLSIQFMPYSDFQLVQLDLTQCSQLAWIFLDFFGLPAVELQKQLYLLSVSLFMCIYVFMLGKMLSMEGTLMHSYCNYSSLLYHLRVTQL